MERCQPYYAVPSKFHLLEALPLTMNGKVDKKLLKTSIEQGNLTTISTPNEKPVTTIVQPQAVVLSEKTLESVPTSPSTSSLAISDELNKRDLEAAIPDKIEGKRRRGLHHRVLIAYRKLFTIVGLINIGAALAVILTGLHREWVGNITAMNLTLAVLMRQEFVINTLYTILCRISQISPLPYLLCS